MNINTVDALKIDPRLSSHEREVLEVVSKKLQDAPRYIPLNYLRLFERYWRLCDGCDGEQ